MAGQRQQARLGSSSSSSLFFTGFGLYNKTDVAPCSLRLPVKLLYNSQKRGCGLTQGERAKRIYAGGGLPDPGPKAQEGSVILFVWVPHVSCSTSHNC